MNRFSYVKKNYPGVLILGSVSFFTDISSEMLYPITPIFLTSILGSSMLSVGIIEGVAEGLASLLKTYSGFWSDQINKRKPFIFVGYLLSALSRPLIGLSTTALHVLGARSLDRVGKGLRSAPRDALIADFVGPQDLGLAFGWHRSMDTLGAVIGPLLAIFFVGYFSDLREAYYWAIIPGLISVLIIFWIKEPEKVTSVKSKKFDFNWYNYSKEYKNFIIGWTFFCLTNSSDAFLILRMKDAGLDFVAIILIYAFYNLVYALLSPSLGHLSDKIGARKVLIIGLIIFTFVYMGFAFSDSVSMFILLFFLYGSYMAATDGVSKSYAVRLVKPENKASSLGILGTATGVSQILASIVTGFLWDRHGSTVALLFTCVGSFCFILILLFLIKDQRRYDSSNMQ